MRLSALRWLKPGGGNHPTYWSGPLISARAGMPCRAISAALLLISLWLLTHRYQGFDNDAKLYAVQALAYLHPHLATDLFLANISKGGYTVFPRLYAESVAILGLERAALILTVIFTVWLFAAAWNLALKVSDYSTSWLTIAVLMIAAGGYGAYDVFHLSEESLTARLPAEALIITAFAVHFSGRSRLAILLSAIAMTVHPLMALPGLLVLVCLRAPIRWMILGAAGVSICASGIALATAYVPLAARLTPPMDAAWLEIVRERSQYLFSSLWTVHDWSSNAKPFVCLALTVAIERDVKILRLGVSAMLVGATGLLVNFLATAFAPIVILLQGQAWRWVWVTTFVCLLMLIPTVARVWRDGRCGPACALLLVAGWLFPAVDGLACTSLALLLWSIRKYINPSAASYLRIGTFAFAMLVGASSLGNAWTVAASPFDTGRESLWLQEIRNIFGFPLVAAFICWVLLRSVAASRSMVPPALISLTLLLLSAKIAPSTFTAFSTAGTSAEIKEFTAWRSAMPPSSTVFIASDNDPGAFAWFTLDRPSYLSLAQSAGVVFSRAIAMEVRRRSDALRLLADPDWRILSRITRAQNGRRVDLLPSIRPLTSEILLAVCRDVVLDFVIAKEKVGFESIQHIQTGDWRDWNLYDCRRVRSARSTT